MKKPQFQPRPNPYAAPQREGLSVGCGPQAVDTAGQTEIHATPKDFEADPPEFEQKTLELNYVKNHCFHAFLNVKKYPCWTLACARFHHPHLGTAELLSCSLFGLVASTL